VYVGGGVREWRGRGADLLLLCAGSRGGWWSRRGGERRGSSMVQGRAWGVGGQEAGGWREEGVGVALWQTCCRLVMADGMGIRQRCPAQPIKHLLLVLNMCWN
jgi:hypothetical protein